MTDTFYAEIYRQRKFQKKNIYKLFCKNIQKKASKSNGGFFEWRDRRYNALLPLAMPQTPDLTISISSVVLVTAAMNASIFSESPTS